MQFECITRQYGLKNCMWNSVRNIFLYEGLEWNGDLYDPNLNGETCTIPN